MLETSSCHLSRSTKFRPVVRKHVYIKCFLLVRRNCTFQFYSSTIQHVFTEGYITLDWPDIAPGSFRYLNVRPTCFYAEYYFVNQIKGAVSLMGWRSIFSLLLNADFTKRMQQHCVNLHKLFPHVLAKLDFLLQCLSNQNVEIKWKT